MMLASKRYRFSEMGFLQTIRITTGPVVINFFVMLNSAEYKIFSCNKYANANTCNSRYFHIY